MKPPKKTVAVDKIAHIKVQPNTFQNARPNDEPNPSVKLNNAKKLLKPTYSKLATIDVGPPIEVNAKIKPNKIGIIEINDKTNNAGDKTIYSNPSSQTFAKYSFWLSTSSCFLSFSDVR